MARSNEVQTIITYRDPRSPAAEAYRVLRTNLQYSSPDNPVRSIMVTSATSGEGKSTTTVNLAVTFAQSGKNVLLVDGDLRKPSIHKAFALNNVSGLSSLIVSGDSVKRVALLSWIDNLSIIPSGPIPPNPAELLSSKRAKDLFNMFVEEYDMVIIDSPPVGAGSDALILSTLAGGTLFVVDYGKIPKERAKAAVNQLKNINANILGVIMNRVPIRGTGYNYYEYRN